MPVSVCVQNVRLIVSECICVGVGVKVGACAVFCTSARAGGRCLCLCLWASLLCVKTEACAYVCASWTDRGTDNDLWDQEAEA